MLLQGHRQSTVAINASIIASYNEILVQWRHQGGGAVGAGAERPGDTIRGAGRGDTRMELIFAAEFRKSTGQTTLEGGEGNTGSGDETTAIKRSSVFRGGPSLKKLITFYLKKEKKYSLF